MDEKTLDVFIETLVRLLALRDTETEEHTRRVAAVAVDLAKAYGIPQDQRIHFWRGALLHDIGKIGIPDFILQKNSNLNPDEFSVIQQHPIFARNLLENIPHLRPALEIPYNHHERWNGSGYPRGLKKEAIPLSARIFSIVDVWDALLSNRPYRPAWKRERADEYIYQNAGVLFDPAVVDIFIEMNGKRDDAPIQAGLSKADTMYEGKKIVVIDDDPAYVQIYELVFSGLIENGGMTLFYPHLDNAIDYLKMFNRIDLILLEPQLKNGINGFDLLSKLKQVEGLAHIPAVCITSGDPKRSLPIAKQRGFSGFIAKTIEHKVLFNLLNDCMNGLEVWHAG